MLLSGKSPKITVTIERGSHIVERYEFERGVCQGWELDDGSIRILVEGSAKLIVEPISVTPTLPAKSDRPKRKNKPSRQWVRDQRRAVVNGIKADARIKARTKKG